MATLNFNSSGASASDSETSGFKGVHFVTIDNKTVYRDAYTVDGDNIIPYCVCGHIMVNIPRENSKCFSANGSKEDKIMCVRRALNCALFFPDKSSEVIMQLKEMIRSKSQLSRDQTEFLVGRNGGNGCNAVYLTKNWNLASIDMLSMTHSKLWKIPICVEHDNAMTNLVKGRMLNTCPDWKCDAGSNRMTLKSLFMPETTFVECVAGVKRGKKMSDILIVSNEVLQRTAYFVARNADTGATVDVGGLEALLKMSYKNVVSIDEVIAHRTSELSSKISRCDRQAVDDLIAFSIEEADVSILLFVFVSVYK